MSTHLRCIGRYGNAIIAVVFGFVAVFSLGRYGLSTVLLEVGVCAMAVFNFQIVGWAATLTSEEELLKAEVRKAELRQKLAGLGNFAVEPHAAAVGSEPATELGRL